MDLDKKIGQILAKINWLNMKSRQFWDGGKKSEEWYVLQLEKEALQIAKHAVLMVQLIREQRERLDLKSPFDTTTDEIK